MNPQQVRALAEPVLLRNSETIDKRHFMDAKKFRNDVEILSHKFTTMLTCEWQPGLLLVRREGQAEPEPTPCWAWHASIHCCTLPLIDLTATALYAGVMAQAFEGVGENSPLDGLRLTLAGKLHGWRKMTQEEITAVEQAN